MGKEVVMKKDLDLRPEDVKDKDILISLGKCRSRMKRVKIYLTECSLRVINFE
jgi:hypothetical protein